MSELSDRLVKMKGTTGIQANLGIICNKCKTRKTWNEAAKSNWKYDPKGKNFNAFFCVPCQGLL